MAGFLLCDVIVCRTNLFRLFDVVNKLLSQRKDSYSLCPVDSILCSETYFWRLPCKKNPGKKPEKSAVHQRPCTLMTNLSGCNSAQIAFRLTRCVLTEVKALALVRQEEAGTPEIRHFENQTMHLRTASAGDPSNDTGLDRQNHHNFPTAISSTWPLYLERIWNNRNLNRRRSRFADNLSWWVHRIYDAE